MRFHLLAAAAAVLLHLGPAHTQSFSTLTPGTRVRVAPNAAGFVDGRSFKGNARWIVGTVRSVDRATLSLQLEGEGADSDYTVPVSTVGQLEVSSGTRSSGAGARRGAVRGGLLGAVIATVPLILGRFDPDGRDDDDSDFGDDDSEREDKCSLGCQVVRPRGSNWIRNEAIGIAGGAVVGALVGSRARERWVPVLVPRTALLVSPNGLAVRIGTR